MNPFIFKDVNMDFKRVAQTASPGAGARKKFKPLEFLRREECVSLSLVVLHFHSDGLRRAQRGSFSTSFNTLCVCVYLGIAALTCVRTTHS